MANANAPFGFRHVESVGGGAPTFQQLTGLVASNDSNALYTGDPVTQLATGYITRATAGTDPVLGIFVGCEYVSSAAQRTVQKPNFVPGDVLTGDVTAYVIEDPNATFEVQASGANIPFSAIGANAQFSYTAGSSLTGQSAVSLLSGSQNTTATLPFRIIGIKASGTAGYDPTGAYNIVYVTFNNQSFKNTTGI